MIGYHVNKYDIDGKPASLGDAFVSHMEFLRDYGFENRCAQAFVAGPQNYKLNVDDNDKRTIHNYIKTNDTPLVIHGSYVDNPWNTSSGHFKRSIHNIKQEMRVGKDMLASGVIIHLAAMAARKENLERVVYELSHLEESVRKQMSVYLEINAAKSSPNTFETPEKIKALISNLNEIESGLDFGLCIDTAHLYSCGKALDTREAAEVWLDGFDSACEVYDKKLNFVLHLNDSKSVLGSGIDRHQTLTEGNLWSAWGVDGSFPIEDCGLLSVIEWAEEKHAITILERDSKGIIKDLTLINALGYFTKSSDFTKSSNGKEYA